MSRKKTLLSYRELVAINASSGKMFSTMTSAETKNRTVFRPSRELKTLQGRRVAAKRPQIVHLFFGKKASTGGMIEQFFGNRSQGQALEPGHRWKARDDQRVVFAEVELFYRQRNLQRKKTESLYLKQRAQITASQAPKVTVLGVFRIL